MEVWQGGVERLLVGWSILEDASGLSFMLYF